MTGNTVHTIVRMGNGLFLGGIVAFPNGEFMFRDTQSPYDARHFKHMDSAKKWARKTKGHVCRHDTILNEVYE